MSPEAGRLLEVVQVVAVGVIATSLLALLILAAFLFPVLVEHYRARTRQCFETTVVLPLVERDLAKIATHGQASENLLRELRDEQRSNTVKLDALVGHSKRG